MYEIPYHIESEYLTPPEPTLVDKCSLCCDPLYDGEDVWEIEEAGLLICEHCMDTKRTVIDKYERELRYAI